MRKPYVIAVFSILVAGALILFFFSNSEETAEENPQQAESGEQEESTEFDESPKSSSDDLPKPLFESAAEAEEVKEEMVGIEDPQRVAYLAAFETPIEYYGRVLDEAGVPIIGAEIRFSAINNPYEPLSPETKYTRLSDSDGSFSITGITGTRLVLKISKEGYRMLPNSQSSLGYHPSATRRSDGEIPTVERPAVFVMEKLSVPAHLIKRRLKQKLPLNGKAVSINLLSGNLSSDGSFKISLKSDYNPDTYEAMNWEAAMKLQNGGLVENTDQANFEAPEDGYTSEIVFRVTEGMERIPKSFRQEVYFTVDNGRQYGRGTLYISSSGTFSFSYYLNPQGARNLEYDRALDVTEQY
jgi:hypothetical protein